MAPLWLQLSLCHGRGGHSVCPGGASGLGSHPVSLAFNHFIHVLKRLSYHRSSSTFTTYISVQRQEAYQRGALGVGRLVESIFDINKCFVLF